MTRIRGTEHEHQPKAEALLALDLSEMRALGSDDARYGWHLVHGGEVCRAVASTGGAFKGFNGILDELGEIPAWDYLAQVVLTNGFDLYRDDDRFEVFHGHTDPVGDEPLTLGEAIHAFAVAGKRVSNMLPEARTAVAFDTAEQRTAWSWYPFMLPPLEQVALALEIWDQKIDIARLEQEKKEMS